MGLLQLQARPFAILLPALHQHWLKARQGNLKCEGEDMVKLAKIDSIQDSGLALTASGYWLGQAAALAALPMQERAAPPRCLHRNNQKAAERIWKLWELSWEAKNPRIVCNKEAFELHGIIVGLYSLHHCVGSSFFALHFRVLCSSSRRAPTVIISSCLPICANFTLQPDLSLPTYMSSLLIQISLSLLLSASTTRARQGGSFIKGKRL